MFPIGCKILCHGYVIIGKSCIYKTLIINNVFMSWLCHYLECAHNHIHNVYQKAELQKERTCKKFLHVQNEGKRTVQRNIAHYGMDMIVAVDYRVKSSAATQFRQWATERRKQIIVETKQREVIIVSTEKNQQK